MNPFEQAVLQIRRGTIFENLEDEVKREAMLGI